MSHLAERGAASTAPKVTPPKVTGGFAGAVIGGAFGDELATRTRERVARIGREEMARRAATAESKSDGGGTGGTTSGTNSNCRPRRTRAQ